MKLKPAQRLFAKLYATPGETFSNATRSYVKAFDHYVPHVKRDPRGLKPTEKKEMQDALDVAGTLGAALLRNVEICALVDSYLKKVLDDVTVDQELGFVIAQRDDLSAKVRGIVHLDERLGKLRRKMDLTTDGKPLGVIYLPKRPDDIPVKK